MRHGHEKTNPCAQTRCLQHGMQACMLSPWRGRTGLRPECSGLIPDTVKSSFLGECRSIVGALMCSAREYRRAKAALAGTGLHYLKICSCSEEK